MTDPTPNALSPQGKHAPGPKPLSPSAQKVADAVFVAYDDETSYIATGEQHAGRIAAAALRALADQLRLELPLGDTDADAGVFAAHHAIYAAILAIANELEAQ